MNNLKKLLCSILLISGLSSVTNADDYSFQTTSLVGFEGGYSSFDVEKSPANPNENIQTYDVGEVGLKIGAQTTNYRIFLSLRNYFPDDYDYFLSYGIEFQYLFNFTKSMNFFLGINAGMIDGRFTPTGESSSRTISDPYFGGDLGFNYHINETYDIELGLRTMTTDATNTKNDVTYTFDNIVTGYASFIIKFQLD